MKVLCAFGRHAYGDPDRGDAYEFAQFWPAIGSIATEVRHFNSFDRTTYKDFADLNARFLDTVLTFQPDVIFLVLMSYEIWSETLDIVRRFTNAAVLNWGTDDSWKYAEFSRFIAPHVDLYVTTYADKADQARREGYSNFGLSQWGLASRDLAEPISSDQCRYDVSFVGGAYGNRGKWIEDLSARGVRVACFGHGWPGGVVSTEQMREVYRTSRVSLNFADSGRQLRGARLVHDRQIKARTFEVPGCGGVLLTQGAPQLDGYFDIGKEIAVFDDIDELASRVEGLLANPERRDAMARAGHERVMRDHTYEARFQNLFDEAQQRATSRVTSRATKLDTAAAKAAQLEASKKHAVGSGARLLRCCFVSAAGLFVRGKRRDRAARRALFELSWRVFGARTYSAAGLPGRLFYAES